MDMEALAKCVHEARFDGPPSWLWENEDQRGQTYCYRIANAVHLHILALSGSLAPEGEPATCVLCQGTCRGHSLGHPEEWEPEAGSAADAGEVRTYREGVAKEGWLLMPAEPTPEMIAAAWDVVTEAKNARQIHRLGPGVGTVDVYRAMVAAIRKLP